MCSRVLSNQKIATIIAMMKDILAKTKKDFTESKLLDQALKLLFMMSMKGSLSQKNMFMLPAGPSVKKYIDETTRLFNLRVSNTPHESIALKTIQVMPALLLQKPRKSLKSKEHLEALK